ncbi:hypothetical protein H1P_3750007 [Hyella patelloides LEGE 07179]|uniref:Uncharacterized protein n=1 Tax=Hyella patelloides LEGE 07179 TaxID=945734 RepID=A0A563VWM6_9CYAN|nr:hypothetical protein H1P_3750007 [Hyella patelloides LEGE 07179]
MFILGNQYVFYYNTLYFYTTKAREKLRKHYFSFRGSLFPDSTPGVP